MNQEVVFQPFQLDGYECVAYHPKEIGSEQLPTVYLQDGKQVLNDLEEWLKEQVPQLVIVFIEPKNRWDEYSPWKEKAPEGMPFDFGGKASDYIQWLVSRAVPYVEENYPASREVTRRVVGGYSFGGLVSLYSGYINSDFGAILSCSTSFWYPKFLDYVLNHSLKKQVHLYMSVGDAEGKTSPLINQMQVPYTFEAKEHYEKTLGKELVTFVMHEGDHRDRIPEKLSLAIEWVVNLYS